MKLLIVDDNKDIRTFLRNLFEHQSKEIIECSDGITAVRLYDEKKPDYVLMDIEMKNMDGLTAAGKIIEKHSSAKIIIVTSYANAKYYENAMRIGAKAFVSKDNLFEIEEIINK